MIKAMAAVDRNWAIGKCGSLLTSIPEDMRFFREITSGNVVIMGRKTLESFPGGKPLSNRVNIVVTSNPDYDAKGAVTAESPMAALKKAKKYNGCDIYIIGGESIYRALLNECDEALITYIDYAYDADRYFPDLDRMPEWVLISESDEQTHFDTVYYFREYLRRKDYKPL